MPSFKPKANKKIKINKKTATTLDGKHKEFISEFNQDELNTIPALKQERDILKDKLETQKAMLTIEQRLDIEDRIADITKNINNLRLKKKDYFLDNSKFIFDYFENKKNISKNDLTSSSSSNSLSHYTSANPQSKNNLIHSFFKIKNENVEQIDNKNNNIVQKYLSNIDDSFMDINSFVKSTDICEYCYKGEMIPLEDEGVLICNTCSRNIPYLIENEKPSYKEPPKEVCFYAYKRINHFKEIIAQFQGKETTQIPPEVIENIKQQIKKERIDVSQINNQKTKEILKKLGYNKYYEHIPFIKDKLGIKPPIMSQELEETLFNLFMELQAPYSKFCPNDRVNFLNYYYTAYKLCELLGETQYLEHYPMLKDPEKRIDQDAIWKKICEELNWEFIPTV
jgi:hypothetical protein